MTSQALPDAYFQGMAAQSRLECPYGVSTQDDRIARGWWLAGYHDGQMQSNQPHRPGRG